MMIIQQTNAAGKTAGATPPKKAPDAAAGKTPAATPPMNNAPVAAASPKAAPASSNNTSNATSIPEIKGGMNHYVRLFMNT